MAQFGKKKFKKNGVNIVFISFYQTVCNARLPVFCVKINPTDLCIVSYTTNEWALKRVSSLPDYLGLFVGKFKSHNRKTFLINLKRKKFLYRKKVLTLCSRIRSQIGERVADIVKWKWNIAFNIYMVHDSWKMQIEHVRNTKFKNNLATSTNHAMAKTLHAQQMTSNTTLPLGF